MEPFLFFKKEVKNDKIFLMESLLWRKPYFLNETLFYSFKKEVNLDKFITIPK
jgi:hypothetical protein